jgi:hypothetical protein
MARLLPSGVAWRRVSRRRSGYDRYS